jgi:ABC-type uncharacterized transport system ATPase subunit
VLVHEPKLILLDEPFAGVDTENSEVLEDSIIRLNEKGVCFVVVEHKRQWFEKLSIKEIELELGTIKN